MKRLGEPQRVQRATNCDGPNQWFTEITHEVEEEDIGRTWHDYLGFRHSEYRFHRTDVGRRIAEMSQPGYRMWSFATNPKPNLFSGE